MVNEINKILTKYASENSISLIIQKKHIFTSLFVFGIFLIYITFYFGNFDRIFNAYDRGEKNIVSGNVNSAKNPLMMFFMTFK